MYKNLEAELARNGISKNSLAKTLKLSQKGLYLKLSGETDFTLTEVMKIKSLFKGLTLEYLFTVSKDEIAQEVERVSSTDNKYYNELSDKEKGMIEELSGYEYSHNKNNFFAIEAVKIYCQTDDLILKLSTLKFLYAILAN